MKSKLKNTLPKIEQWIHHEKTHGDWIWTSSQGHFCLVENCEININPRSIEPILKFLERIKNER